MKQIRNYKSNQSENEAHENETNSEAFEDVHELHNEINKKMKIRQMKKIIMKGK